MSARTFIDGKIDWDDPTTGAPGSGKPPSELVAKARETGARSKKLVRGDGGFFMNRSELPAGFHIPPHSHSHGELLVVLKGSCTVDDEQGRAIELSAKDSIVIDPNYRYGITCGADGMEFLTIRAGEASSDFAG